ncbi:hypothetical protein M997_1705 [Proteus hauseri ATCC 700826]|uniref:Uncharacterized protein n=1 Tax=Proteus hauseri ATCC 700826 TaxID=1354271 RepID=A0AAJ3HTK4_PROHU|nr:hypothetical protein [Proteus hauseri]OAT47178.1 hypothetical protein M997_1705 [Proteus hauseri ATCC 700826]
MTPYLICRFEKQTLSNLIKECFNSKFPDIYKKIQIDYIYRYLTEIKCKSVLLEPVYIDKDYLEDYKQYYVKGFNNKGYKTSRLHFFSSELDHKTIDDYLENGMESEKHNLLQQSYLGFMIIKPLPKTFIGKTCLIPYPSLIKNNDKKCILREYSIDLFGIPLKVKSIAFQEQDMVVAAYATTAIWSSLHALNYCDIRSIPSCSEITINAINHINNSNNSFPNTSLTTKQMLRSIDIEKIKHHLFKANRLKIDEFHEIVKTHIDSKIPLLLRGTIYDITNGNYVRKNDYTVTILGYKERGRSRAIYIHDDRLGPFVRAIYRKKITGDEEWGFIVQEKNDEIHWEEAHEIFIPDILISITPKKVRLSSELAINTCRLIKSIYTKLLEIELDTNSSEKFLPIIKFSVKLKEISEIRNELLCYDFNKSNHKEAINYCKKKRLEFLTQSYACYHWVASFSLNNEDSFDILFDATDIPQGDVVSEIIYKDYYNSKVILDVMKKLASRQDILHSSPLFRENSFIVSFFSFLMTMDYNYTNYLDETYGRLRAPSYLKPEEYLGGKITGNKTSKIYYGRTNKTLKEITADLKNNIENSFMIWAITDEGALVIGEEINNNGHPSLTGFKPARIAGELFIKDEVYYINSKSGRYSRDYSNPNNLLKNAINRFKEIFPDDDLVIEIMEFSGV